MSERPMYLTLGEEASFATHHIPGASDGLRTAVVLLPPFGWDEMATHRARREWAIDLERRGHHVLRLDLPGTADSAGTLNDTGRWETWIDAARSACRWLRAESSVARIAAVGVGTGGYLAFEAVARGDADEAVLWATPVTGKSFLRELKAHGALEAQRVADSGGPAAPEPSVGLEAGGYVVEQELAAAIGAVDLGARQLPAAARILLVGRDGTGLNMPFAGSLREQGIDVETADGRGYAAMVVQPDQSIPPRELFVIVADWLDRGDSSLTAALTAATRSSELPSSSASIDGVVERPFSLERPSGTLRGVIVEPEGAALRPLTLVFLNAGGIRRTGPSRLWAIWAREWARRGVPSLRLDNEGIGDADGDGERYREVGRFHDEHLVSHVSAALEELCELGLPPRFVTIGLCSGGCWAYQTALAHDRVAAAVMLNSRVLHWHEHLEPARDMRMTRLLIRPLTWKRLLRGDVPIRRWRRVAGWMASGAATRLQLRGDFAERSVFAWQAQRAADGFSSLQDAGKRAHFIFCDGEPLDDELTEAGLFSQLENWPSVTRRQIPGRDHTLKPIWMHRFATRAFDEVIEGELDRIADEIALQA
jgi:alpha-beta hydrolase superfamily lysophospholipase